MPPEGAGRLLGFQTQYAAFCPHDAISADVRGLGHGGDFRAVEFRLQKRLVTHQSALPINHHSRAFMMVVHGQDFPEEPEEERRVRR